MEQLDTSIATQQQYLQVNPADQFSEETMAKIQKAVKNICDKDPTKKPYEALSEVLYKQFNFPTLVNQKLKKEAIRNQKFNRNVQEIYQSGYMTGCTDYAKVYSTLARQMGMPTTFLATTEARSMQQDMSQPNGTFVGHAFCEVFDESTNSWVLVDPTNNKVQQNYDPNNFKLTSHKVYGSYDYIPYYRNSDERPILEGVAPTDKTEQYIRFQYEATQNELNQQNEQIQQNDPTQQTEPVQQNNPTQQNEQIQQNEPIQQTNPNQQRTVTPVTAEEIAKYRQTTATESFTPQQPSSPSQTHEQNNVPTLENESELTLQKKFPPTK